MLKIQAYRKQNVALINANNIKNLAVVDANKKATTVLKEA